MTNFELKNLDITKFTGKQVKKFKTSSPKTDLKNEKIESITFEVIAFDEADRLAALFEERGYTDLHGVTQEGTEYLLVNNYIQVFGSHDSNIKNFLKTENGNTVCTAKIMSYSKDRSKFIFA